MTDGKNNQSLRKLQNAVEESSIYRSKQARYSPAKWLQKRSASRQLNRGKAAIQNATKENKVTNPTRIMAGFIWSSYIFPCCVI